MDAGTGTLSGEIYIGARHRDGVVDEFLEGNIQAFVVWDTATGHATWMPAVSAAMAALTG